MRVYLDICCLKRPFDDQGQLRIRSESEAVLAVMSVAEAVEFVRAPAHDLENDMNPLPSRASKVRAWLTSLPTAVLPDAALHTRVEDLMKVGFKGFDALHLASAELAGAEAFATCDDRLLATAKRRRTELKVRVLDPIELAREVLP